VSDRATLEWMRALYDAHFARGLGAAESLRDACRAVLARRRHAKESTHPFYWGGFVATGSSD
jgi:CHAT domain-containing protein